MKFSQVLKYLRSMLKGAYEQNRIDIQDTIQAVVRLEHLVDAYGKTIQKQEGDFAALQKLSQGKIDELTRLVDELQQNLSNNDPLHIQSDAIELVGHSLEMNSHYVDRFPKLAHEFEGWDESNTARLHECVKDREWHHFFDTAMPLLACTGDGDYYEFGCCGAGSMRMALAKAKKWHLNNMEFYAFDSFEGLPTDGSLAMGEEDFLASVQSQGVNADRVTTIPGFYDQSLTKELQEEFIGKKRRPMLINVDCDLHDSALPVFDFIAPLLQAGTVLYLDDFWDTFYHGKAFGTALAFNEFCEGLPRLKFYPFMRVGYWGMSFIAYDPEVFTQPVV